MINSVWMEWWEEGQIFLTAYIPLCQPIGKYERFLDNSEKNANAYIGTWSCRPVIICNASSFNGLFASEKSMLNITWEVYAYI